jgi:glycosyltransferase involved in cell wall biosynthesis
VTVAAWQIFGIGRMTAMRKVAIAMVKNELDIIEAFVRHTATFVDQLVILDNGSTDGTLEVLRSVRKDGIPLDIIEDPLPGFYQTRRTTQLMREHAVRRHGADWVIPLDADEILVASPEHELVSEEIGDEQPLELQWRTYLPDPGDNSSEKNPFVRISHRLQEETWQWVKVMIPARLAARPDATLSQGNHGLLLNDRPVSAVRHPHAVLAHFPVRSASQFMSKVVISHLQFTAMPDGCWGSGWHYRDALDLLRRDPAAFAVEFFRFARQYCVPNGFKDEQAIVSDPVPYRGGRLMHTPQCKDAYRGWLNILRYAEELVWRQAALTNGLDENGRLTLDRHAATIGHQQEILMQAHLHCQEVEAENHRLRVEVDRVCEQRKMLLESRSWKMGSTILAPLRLVRQFLGYRPNRSGV